MHQIDQKLREAYAFIGGRYTPSIAEAKCSSLIVYARVGGSRNALEKYLETNPLTLNVPGEGEISLMIDGEHFSSTPPLARVSDDDQHKRLNLSSVFLIAMVGYAIIDVSMGFGFSKSVTHLHASCLADHAVDRCGHRACDHYFQNSFKSRF